uniref:NADH dehydrogenase subunit 2 n=1 Tax=Pallisentis celatus TaxID=935648 RepID=V5IXC3_PALCE|nr:NADH dehydrogenase subunit 2 [Pallisentis celatus]AFK50143.1 NADH dehydrogenase subunit 2 [Pallisentis celatus]
MNPTSQVSVFVGSGVGVLFYFMTLGLGVLSNSVVFFWLMMELGVYLVVSAMLRGGVWAGVVMLYYCIQSVGSSLMLLGVVWSSFSILFVGVVLKLGLFPLVGWVFLVVKELGLSWTMVVVLGFQKILPFIFLGKFMSQWGVSFEFFVVGALSVITGVVMMIAGDGVVSLISFSSVVHSGWFVSLQVLSPSVLVRYFLIYCVFLWLISFVAEVASSSAFFVFSFLGGLPPCLGFFLKLNLFWAFSWFLAGWIFLFAVCSALAVLGYFRELIFKLMIGLGGWLGTGGLVLLNLWVVSFTVLYIVI